MGLDMANVLGNGLNRVLKMTGKYRDGVRDFWRGETQTLAEFAYRENIGLLAYSPMAFGVLSGKYGR